MSFNHIVNELAQSEVWIVKEYESSNAQLAFFNNVPDSTIDFALFEGEQLMLEGRYHKESKMASYDKGQLLHIVKNLSSEERNANILERLNLSLIMMNPTDLFKENKKMKMK